MPTLAEIQNRVKTLDGHETFYFKSEIKELPKILSSDENIESIIAGEHNGLKGILVATESRLIFVNKLFFGAKVEDFAYDKINSIEYETRFIHGKITIHISGKKATIDDVLKNYTRSFVELVREKIKSNQKEKQEPASTNSIDIADQLERLVKLRQQGFLTDEEFIHQKRKFLGM